jgi:hypothetical protein
LGGFFAWYIPHLMGSRTARIQRKYFEECKNQIGRLDKNAMEGRIIEYWADGKLSEDHRQLLKDKISEYYDSVKGSGYGAPFSRR